MGRRLHMRWHRPVLSSDGSAPLHLTLEVLISVYCPPQSMKYAPYLSGLVVTFLLPPTSHPGIGATNILTFDLLQFNVQGY